MRRNLEIFQKSTWTCQTEVRTRKMNSSTVAAHHYALPLFSTQVDLEDNTVSSVGENSIPQGTQQLSCRQATLTGHIPITEFGPRRFRRLN
ncbi:hypothetical protein T265_00180 [Opisthorchis viverrini]|uniref:Uncharacterized protein n=1 Tax=Opisthorchis viverrini TaxID=6198 RepID=A0A075AD22_OPIVI|nr:hypothetical protein T265_00180 [Opisthorchis viverrini]KER33975.1 hypothetical protein T265_00180 [Opisthorchis viverrini]